MINTVWGSTDKPVSSRRLAELLGSDAGLEGTLYIGYPIIGTPEGSFPIDALFVSPTKGLVLFNVIGGKNLAGYEEAQDEGFNKMQAKLLQHQAANTKIAEVNARDAKSTFSPGTSGPGCTPSLCESARKRISCPLCSVTRRRRCTLGNMVCCRWGGDFFVREGLRVRADCLWAT